MLIVLLLYSSNACGLFLGGTEAGRGLIGLSENEQQDPASVVAAILSAVGGNTGGGTGGGGPLALSFSPNPLVMGMGVSSSFTISFTGTIPADWATNSYDIGFDFTSPGCSLSGFNPPTPNPVIFTPPTYSTVTVNITTVNEPGSCDIIFTVSEGVTPFGAGLTSGAEFGRLPFEITNL